MKALEIFIIVLAIFGLGAVVIVLWAIICDVLDRIKRLIGNLKRKCPKCYARVGEKDLYCRYCGRALFEEVEE